MTFALKAAQVFDGFDMLENMAVVIEGATIADVLAAENLPVNMPVEDLGRGILAPGFIDVQVNGGGGALLNDNPSLATVREIAKSHRRFGTTGMLPTVITDDQVVIDQAIAAVQSAMAQHVPGVLGIHLEGPFLDISRKGAHPEHFIRPMSKGDVDHIAGLECGTVMLTVAPNKVPMQFISELSKRGVLVSLGHAEASYAEVKNALNAGARAFTHVFNAMSQLNGREPGMVGASLTDEKSYCGVIVDGQHVDDIALKVLFAAKSVDHIMLISDAMPPAAGGPETFELQGRVARRVGSRLQLDDGTLAGSIVTMDETVRRCVQLGVKMEDTLRMASWVPAQFLRKGHELGQIKPGFLASLVHLSEDLYVKKTWIDGK